MVEFTLELKPLSSALAICIATHSLGQRKNCYESFYYADAYGWMVAKTRVQPSRAMYMVCIDLYTLRLKCISHCIRYVETT
jgi:hypothetical protein